jgi:hypothetical protein
MTEGEAGESEFVPRGSIGSTDASARCAGGVLRVNDAGKQRPAPKLAHHVRFAPGSRRVLNMVLHDAPELRREPEDVDKIEPGSYFESV